MVTMFAVKLLLFENAQMHLAFFIFFRNFADMKKAIVMGASSGMGYEVAKILLKDGWQIGVAARRVDKLSELAKEFPEQVLTEGIDVTDEDAPRKLLSLIERMGGVELYFHVSGIGKQNPELEETIEMNTVRTNALGFTQMIDTIYNYMKEHGGGHIAVISSIAGTKGLGPAPSYSATKAFHTPISKLWSNWRMIIVTISDLPTFVLDL